MAGVGPQTMQQLPGREVRRQTLQHPVELFPWWFHRGSAFSGTACIGFLHTFP